MELSLCRCTLGQGVTSVSLPIWGYRLKLQEVVGINFFLTFLFLVVMQLMCVCVYSGLEKIDCNQYSIATFFTFCSSNALEPLLF